MTVKELLIKILSKADESGLNKTKRGLKQTKDGVGRVSGAFGKMKRAAGSAFKAAGKAAFNFSRNVAGHMRTAVVGISVTIAGAVAEFTKYNIDMARAWTMMDTGLRGFIKTRSDVTKMSGDLGVAKSQLAKGLYQALSAGVPEQNVLTFLRTAAKTAVADGSDVSTAVDGITTVLNAFHLETGKAQEVTDQLFKTVANGKTTFGELASQIATAAPTADSAGMGFEQLLAATATLTKQGTPTAVAMTQIRAAILSMNKELGDGWAKTMSFQEAAGKMAEKAGGSQTKLQKMTGSVEAMNAVLGLTGKNAKMAADDLAATGEARGSLDKAFGKVDQFRHWPKMWQTVLGVVTKIGGVFDRVLRPIVKEITGYIAKWRDAENVWAGLEEKLTAMREAAQDIWAFLSEGKGEALGEMWEGVKDILIGALQRGAELARDIFLKFAPKVGEMIGAAAKKAMTSGGRIFQKAETAAEAAKAGEIGKGQGLLYSMSFGLLGSKSTKAAVAKRLKERRAAELEAVYGEDMGPQGSAGLARIQKGTARFGSMAQRGREIRGNRGPLTAAAAAGAPSAEQQAALEEERRMERARKILQMRLDAERADVSRVQGHIAKSGGRGASAAQTILAREQADVRRASAAVESLTNSGDDAVRQLVDRVLRFAEKTERDKQMILSQIRNLPI